MNVVMIEQGQLQEFVDTLKRIEQALFIEKPKANEYYDSSEVMRIMNWSRTTFQRWIKTVPSIKVQGRLMIHKTVVDNLFSNEVKNNEQTNKTKM